MPLAAFGPGTPDYVARHIEKLDIEDSVSPDAAEKQPKSEEDEREYGLKGSYF